MVGGVLFGAGWAIAGACPGPALANLILPLTNPCPEGGEGFAVFAIAYALGVWLADAGMHLVAGKGFVVEDTAAAAGPSAKISPVAPKSASEEIKKGYGAVTANSSGSPIWKVTDEAL